MVRTNLSATPFDQGAWGGIGNMLDSRINTQLVELPPKFVALIGTDALRCPKDGEDVRLEPLSYGGRGA